MPQLDINNIRLQNQHLAQPQFSQPAEIVKWLGAVQAQDYGGAKWAIGQRLKGGNDDLIEKAFTNGDILRTHVMRPTWHFVTPEDIRWMLDLTAKRVQMLATGRHKQLELDNAVFTKCANILTTAMEGGKQLMRTEIQQLLQKASIATDEQRFIHIMMELELTQLVCSGGRQGKQFTYTLLDERVPSHKTLDREEALSTLAERYFTAHGPATLKDFAWWSGLTIADCKSGLEMIKQKLINEILTDNTYWFVETQQTIKPSPVYLLPNYDEYIVSYADRSSTIKEKDIIKADPRGTIFNHTLIINGRITGIWKHAFKTKAVEITIIPFKPLSKAANSAITTVVKRYVKFSGMKEFRLTITDKG